MESRIHHKQYKGPRPTPPDPPPKPAPLPRTLIQVAVEICSTPQQIAKDLVGEHD